MRLTTSIRSAFVRSVMSDVPQVDYREQANKLIQAALDKHWLANVGSLELRTKMGEMGYLDKNHYGTGMGYYMARGCWDEQLHKQNPDLKAALRELVDKYTEQNVALSALEEKIRAASNAASTRKALVEMLPEFEKYLPDEAAKASRSLPVVQGLADAFKQAGWPVDRTTTATA